MQRDKSTPQFKRSGVPSPNKQAFGVFALAKPFRRAGQSRAVSVGISRIIWEARRAQHDCSTRQAGSCSAQCSLKQQCCLAPKQCRKHPFYTICTVYSQIDRPPSCSPLVEIKLLRQNKGSSWPECLVEETRTHYDQQYILALKQCRLHAFVCILIYRHTSVLQHYGNRTTDTKYS